MKHAIRARIMAALGATVALVALGSAVATASAPAAMTTAPNDVKVAAATTTVEYFHKIAALHSGDALAVNRGVTINGEPVVAWPFSVNQKNTQWSLQGVGSAPAAGYSGTFLLRARHSDQCLDVSGSITPGASLVQRPCDAADTSQQWFYGPASESGNEQYRFFYNRAAGLPGSPTALVMKVLNGGPLGSPLVLAAKNLFSSSLFAITAPVKVTSTTEVLG